MANINNFMLKELSFRNGNWEGKFEFIISIDDEHFVGIAPFTYSKRFNIHGLIYPSSITDSQRKNIRKSIIKASEIHFPWLKEHIFDKREIHSFKPVVEKFEIDQSRSFQNNLYVNFKLKESSVEFFAYIFLSQDLWHCEIKSKKEFQNEDYKRYISWEDDVFDQLTDHIKKVQQYRMKFVVHSKSYKFK